MDKELKEKLVKWLITGGYTEGESIDQINEAKVITSGNLITITYANNIIDVIRVADDGELKHVK